MANEHDPNAPLRDADLPRGFVVSGAVRVAPLVVVPQMLKERGLDPVQVIAEVGVKLSLFSDPENIIPFETMGRLFRACEKRTGCAHFGLLVGQKGGGETLGLVGLFAQHAPDVGTALRDIILHLHLHDRGAVPNLSVRDGVAVLGYAIYQPGVVGTNHIYDGAIAITFNIMRELCGPDWAPTQVLFCHSKPSDTHPFRQFFKSRLRFDAEETAVVFPARWLQQPIRGSNPQLREILGAEIDRLETQLGDDLPSQLRRVLRNLLVSGRGSLEEVAELFALHRRTLNRRLKAQGTSFQQLVEEVRFEIAHQLLGETKMPLADVAALLDYADTASFSRAFRRWSGTTPGAWREALRDNGPSRASAAR